jgi:proteasome lid subunit RPN8/RPN11
VALLLPGAVVDAMRAHAERAYPDECCGAVVGEEDGAERRVLDAWPLPNAAPAPQRRFVVAPADYRVAERRARDAGLRLLGFYHSHPDAPAQPSTVDLASAFPHLTYVIISVEGGEARETTAWRLRDDRSRFDSEDIIWRRES